MSKKISLEQMSDLILEILNSEGKVSFISAGHSMLPTIRDRKDTVTLVKPEKEIKRGDIVFYKRDNGQYVLHRVMYTDGNIFVMRGDNQWYNEYNIRNEQIIGILWAFERSGKTHKVTDTDYKIYVKLLPIIRSIRKWYYWFKSQVYKFVKFLLKK